MHVYSMQEVRMKEHTMEILFISVCALQSLAV